MAAPINPLHSVSGYLHQKLAEKTEPNYAPSMRFDGQGPNLDSANISRLKITGRVVGDAALFITSLVEMVIRNVVALIAKGASYFVKIENFNENYVTPFSEMASLSREVFSNIKADLSAQYQEHMKPFLAEKVKVEA